MRTETQHDRQLIDRETRSEIEEATAGLLLGLDDAATIAANPPPSHWRRYQTGEGFALVSGDELVTVYTGPNAETMSARALEVIERAEVVARSGRA